MEIHHVKGIHSSVDSLTDQTNSGLLSPDGHSACNNSVCRAPWPKSMANFLKQPYVCKGCSIPIFPSTDMNVPKILILEPKLPRT